MSLNKNYYSIKNTKINHGFFNRLHGFSKKEFKSLNCSLSNGDNKKLVYKNRLKALRQLKLHKKPIILLNVGGCWNNLNSLVESIVEAEFVHEDVNELFTIVDDVKGVFSALDEA